MKFSEASRESEFDVDRSAPPFNIPKIALAQVLIRIVEIEGPVHPDVLLARVRVLWGLERAGKYTKWAVNRAVTLAFGQGMIERDNFYSLPGCVSKVRNRSNVKLALLRRPTMIPQSEIDAAVRGALDIGETGRDAVHRTIRDAFGYDKSSPLLDGLIGPAVQRAVSHD